MPCALRSTSILNLAAVLSSRDSSPIRRQARRCSETDLVFAEIAERYGVFGRSPEAAISPRGAPTAWLSNISKRRRHESLAAEPPRRRVAPGGDACARSASRQRPGQGRSFHADVLHEALCGRPTADLSRAGGRLHARRQLRGRDRLGRQGCVATRARPACGPLLSVHLRRKRPEACSTADRCDLARPRQRENAGRLAGWHTRRIRLAPRLVGRAGRWL